MFELGDDVIVSNPRSPHYGKNGRVVKITHSYIKVVFSNNMDDYACLDVDSIERVR